MSKDTTRSKEIGLQEKRAKELVLRKKQASKQMAKHYLLFMMIVLTIAYVVDEMTTNITTALQSNIIYELFSVPLLSTGGFDISSTEFNNGVDAFSFLVMLAMPLMFILPFYKSLADKIGRKPFLVFNTFMMGVSMLIIMLSTNWIVFAVGYLLLNFFVPADVQTLYIMENAPPKHRVKIAMGAKSIAILGISSIGLLRLLFLTDDVSSWRNVYIIPVILAIAVAFFVLCMAKETPQFINTRIEQLSKTQEQIDQENLDKKSEGAKTGVLAAFKFVFRHRQLRWAMITACFIGAVAVVGTNYNFILAESMLTEDSITLLVIIYPFSYALSTFIAGFVSDKWGRKTMVISYAGLAVVSLIAFIVTINSVDNGIIAGIIYGLFVSGHYGILDAVYYVIPQESSPTHLRASCVAVVMFISLIGTVVGLLLWTIINSVLTLGVTAIVIAAFSLVVGMTLFAIKVGETKNVDLDTVRGDEWDSNSATN